MLPEKRSENGNETIADREGSQAGAKDQDQVECLSQEPTATEKKDFFFYRFIAILKVSARHKSKCSPFSPVPGGAGAGVCKEAAGR